MSDVRMPAIFFGHGNPMYAITANPYAEKWEALGRMLPVPQAVLSISAHWYVDFIAVTATERSKTIHDFGGFPRELYEVQYPAPGSVALAERVKTLLAGDIDVALDHDWGLDHGTWSVLRHVFPQANVPVVQLSIDETQPPQFHYQLGQKLAPLRDQGVLIMGSGNVVHNLHAFAWGRHSAKPYDWASRFEESVRSGIEANDIVPLIDYELLGEDAMLAVPTPDHYVPLLYVLGTRHKDDKVTFPVDGIDGGSVSMLSVQLR